jgi:hypothetical protein
MSDSNKNVVMGPRWGPPTPRETGRQTVGRNITWTSPERLVPLIRAACLTESILRDIIELMTLAYEYEF